MRVLIVEGNADRGALWQRHLERMGLEVERTGSHEGAIHAIRFFHPDVLVMNLVQSRARPLAIADFAAYHRPRARIIFVTGSGFFSDGSIFALAQNACAVVTQSLAPEDLGAMVAHYGGRTSAVP